MHAIFQSIRNKTVRQSKKRVPSVDSTEDFFSSSATNTLSQRTNPFRSLRGQSVKHRKPTPFSWAEQCELPSDIKYNSKRSGKVFSRTSEDTKLLQDAIERGSRQIARAVVGESRPTTSNRDSIDPEDSTSNHRVERDFSSDEDECGLPEDATADALAGIEWLALHESALRMNLVHRNSFEERDPFTDEGYSSDPARPDTRAVQEMYATLVSNITEEMMPLLKAEHDSEALSLELYHQDSLSDELPRYCDLSIHSRASSHSNYGLARMFPSQVHLSTGSVRSASVSTSPCPLGSSCSAEMDDPATVEPGVAVRSDNVLARIPDQAQWTDLAPRRRQTVRLAA